MSTSNNMKVKDTNNDKGNRNKAITATLKGSPKETTHKGTSINKETGLWQHGPS